LDLLLSGEGDQETLNAAFRAVHSVKGGAAAFGFDNLISFAHKFESVMDLARSDELELTPNVCQVLLRSGDVMESLIEKARDGDNSPSDTMAKVLHELSVILDPNAVEEAAEPAAAEPSPEPAAEVAEEEVEESSHRSVEVHFKPDTGFFRAGHDALKLIVAAKSHGLVKVELEGEVLPLPEFTLDICTVSWRLHFETELETAKLEEFFLVYEAAATWDILEESSEAAEQNAEPVSAAEPEKTSEPVKEAVAEAPPKETPVETKSAPPKADKPASAKKPGVSKSLRVELARVDRLVNLVGEIVITQAALAQRLGEAGPSVDLEVEHSVEAMSRQTRDLQESVMAIRAQPVKSYPHASKLHGSWARGSRRTRGRRKAPDGHHQVGRRTSWRKSYHNDCGRWSWY